MKIKLIPKSARSKRMDAGILTLVPETVEDQEQLEALVKEAKSDTHRDRNKVLKSASIFFRLRKKK